MIVSADKQCGSREGFLLPNLHARSRQAIGFHPPRGVHESRFHGLEQHCPPWMPTLMVVEKVVIVSYSFRLTHMRKFWVGSKFHILLSAHHLINVYSLTAENNKCLNLLAGLYSGLWGTCMLLATDQLDRQRPKFLCHTHWLIATESYSMYTVVLSSSWLFLISFVVLFMHAWQLNENMWKVKKKRKILRNPSHDQVTHIV